MKTSKLDAAKHVKRCNELEDEAQCVFPEVSIPTTGVMCIDFDKLRDHGMLSAIRDNTLVLWSDPECNVNKSFDDACFALVDAAGYNKIETLMMINSINRTELNIRLIAMLSGRD